MINSDSPRLIREFLNGETAFVRKHIRSGSTILEVGCGYGRLLSILSENARRVIGIDFAPRMVQSARKNLYDKENIEIHLMEANKIGLKNECFDYVVCLTASIGNMPNIQLDVLKEMKRTCKKGGEIIISVFSEDAKEAQIENYKRIGLKDITDDGKAIHTSEGFYSRRFTKNELKEMFEECGLNCRIIQICPINYIAYAVKN